jgi:hypothetical protein
MVLAVLATVLQQCVVIHYDFSFLFFTVHSCVSTFSFIYFFDFALFCLYEGNVRCVRT